MEYLDIVDDKGIPTGQIIDRSTAHREGIRHRTSHVWIFRKQNGIVQVMLQKRSKNKDSYPSCYDISSAGHIPAGSDYIPSALRELKEELGLDVQASELIFCGKRQIHYKGNFNDVAFVDNQVSNVYMMWKDVEPKDLHIQKEEVEEVMWMDFVACRKAVKDHSMPNCIVEEELDMLQTALHKQAEL